MSDTFAAAACTSDAAPLGSLLAASSSRVCDSTAVAAAAAAAVSASAAVPTIACPAPRPTLASTAALFLPDQSSSLLLAPSESEIHSDPRYYELGAQLIAALVLFSIAYTLAHVVLGWVRRKERKAKAALREATRRAQEQDWQQRRQASSSSGRHGMYGGGPGVRPRLYHVQPAVPLVVVRPSISLELSDLSPHATPLQRLRRRVRHAIDWAITWPARWRRRRRAHAKMLQLQIQQQLHRARRTSAHANASDSRRTNGSATNGPTPVVSKARRMSTSIAAFLARTSPSVLHSSSSHAAAVAAADHGANASAAQPHQQRQPPGSAALSPRLSPSPTPSLEQLERDAAFATSQLLGSFASSLPWLSREIPGATGAGADATAATAAGATAPTKLVAPRAHRRAASLSLSDTISTISNWSAALSGAAGGGGGGNGDGGVPIAASPSSEFRMSPLSLLSPPPGGALGAHAQSAPGGVVTLSAISPSSPSPSRPLSPSTSAELSPHRAGSAAHAPSSSSSSLHGGDDDDENERSFLTYSLSTFVLCVSIVWIQLLVLSVLSSTPWMRQVVVFSWCTKELVTILWTGTVWLSSVSLFILAPFAFLYFEAEGVFGRRGMAYRVLETVLVLLGLTVLLYGSFHLLHSIVGMDVRTATPTQPRDEEQQQEAAVQIFFWLTDLLLGRWARAVLWGLNLESLESLYSNIYHFLPGLLMLLWTAQRGSIELVGAAYSRLCPLALPSPLQMQAKELRVTQRLNAIKCELATLQRKWAEMHDPVLHQRLAHYEAARGRATSHRAIAPAPAPASSLLAASPSSLPSRHSKKLLLARIEQLQVWHGECTRELRPLTLRGRVAASPYVRNSGWLLLTLVAMLLTWHIVLRVAQREARLIFRGSIFRWFRADHHAPAMLGTDSTAAAAAAAAAGAAGDASAGGLWGLLASLKSLLGTLLSLLTGRGLESRAAGATVLTPLVPLAPSASHGGMSGGASSHASGGPSFLESSPLLSALVDLLRVLLSMLLGINGFRHPAVAFLVDLAVMAFFLLASARHVYASPMLARFSPVHAILKAVEAANAAPRATAMHAEDDSANGGSDGGLVQGASTSASSLSGPPSVPVVVPASDSSSLLFSAQFFTVNAVIFLLLTSSLPIATWMLGLSSFDLLEFYPQASAQLSPAHGAGGLGGGGSFFLHLYNLSFLVLTVWHATQLSKALVVWVLFEKVVRNIERLVERMRVALGWARPNAPQEQRFVLFRRCRARRARARAGPPLSRTQLVLLVLSRLAHAARAVLAPLLRAVCFLVVQLARVTIWAGRHAWEAITVFLLQELSDDDEGDTKSMRDGAVHASLANASLVSAASSASSAQAAAAESEDGTNALAKNESSITSQLLAEVDAASHAAAAAAAAAAAHEHSIHALFADDLQLDLLNGASGAGGDADALQLPIPTPPTHRRTHARHGGSSLAFFPRAHSAPTQGDLRAAAAAAAASAAEENGQDAQAEALLDGAGALSSSAIAGDGYGPSAASVAAGLSDSSSSSSSSLLSADSSTPSSAGVVPNLSLTHFSPLFRSKTASRSLTRSFFMTPGLVPSLKRKLSLSGGRPSAASSSFGSASRPGSVDSSPASGGIGDNSAGGDGDVRLVTEADFPLFSPSTPTMGTIDEEYGMRSASSSATATPLLHYSPFDLDGDGDGEGDEDDGQRGHDDDNGTPAHVAAIARGLVRMPLLDLNASAASSPTAAGPDSPFDADGGDLWTPSSVSSSSVSSRASSASSTPIGAGGSMMMSGGGGGGGARERHSASLLPYPYSARLEPMIEEPIDGNGAISSGSDSDSGTDPDTQHADGSTSRRARSSHSVGSDAASRLTDADATDASANQLLPASASFAGLSNRHSRPTDNGHRHGAASQSTSSDDSDEADAS